MAIEKLFVYKILFLLHISKIINYWLVATVPILKFYMIMNSSSLDSTNASSQPTNGGRNIQTPVKILEEFSTRTSKSHCVPKIVELDCGWLDLNSLEIEASQNLKRICTKFVQALRGFLKAVPFRYTQGH